MFDLRTFKVYYELNINEIIYYYFNHKNIKENLKRQKILQQI